MNIDADLLILGGGCAGLSLGQLLAERSLGSRRTIILEERASYTDDRAWCFWRFGPHRFDHLVGHSWSKMKLAAQGKSIIVDCKSTPYQMINAMPFYNQACELIHRAFHVDLLQGTRVLSPPRQVAKLWHVETDRGRLVARQIVDTIPPVTAKAGDAVLWQSFFGQEVLCEGPVFDPSAVTLMEFTGGLEGAVLFRYVLPISATRALIETTVFGPRPLLEKDLVEYQTRSVTELCKGYRSDVLRSERGILPMGMTRSWPHAPPGYVRAGLMSGGARPSTGYAFQRIQRWAETAFAQLSKGLPASTHPRDQLLLQMMDQLFLKVIRAHPERGAELFLSLFGKADPIRVIRFLSDKASVIDCAAVIAALPASLFLDELWRGLRGRRSLSVGKL